MGLAYREWNKPKREKCVSGSKNGTSESSKYSDIVYGSTKFEICPAGFGLDCPNISSLCFHSSLLGWYFALYDIVCFFKVSNFLFFNFLGGYN